LKWRSLAVLAYINMDFVQIDKANLDTAREIENTIFPHYNALNNYLDSLINPKKSEYYLIKDNDIFIGIIGLYSYDAYPDDAWLGWFGLLEEYRGKGYGRKALEFFEELAKDHGFRFARLFTDTLNNDKTRNFCKHLGFFEERYINFNDPASLKYPISIFSKSLYDERCPHWNNRDIHFTKQVHKQQ